MLAPQEVAVEKRLRASSDRRQRIIDLFVDRQLTPEVYAEQLGRADTEIGTDQQALAALRYDAIDADAAIDYAVASPQRQDSDGSQVPSRLSSAFSRFSFRNACNSKTVNFEPPNWAFFSNTCERIAGLIPVW
jgi:hypothetical protein